jgi:hypothetical protein
MGVHELDVSDGVAVLEAPQQADHLVAGLSWQLSERSALRIEAYDKRYRDTQRRFENLFNPFVLLPELAPDRVPIQPSRANARGIDVEQRVVWNERVTTTLRYSHMDATDHVDGSTVPRRWSQDHTVSAIATWQTDRFGASAALTWHSGWRTSQLPSTLPIGTTLAVDEILNNAHLRDYVSLDVGTSASWKIGRSTLTLYADVTNVLDRNNVAGVDYSIEDDGINWIFLPETQSILTIVATAGVLIAF